MAEVRNVNYRPYPGVRTFAKHAPTYLGEPFKYGWGNEQIDGWGFRSRGVGGVFSQAFNDYNTRFISASSGRTSSGIERFAEGFSPVKSLLRTWKTAI
ncbi:MAG TPA: hypothetical protein VD993_11820 [Chitinophagaceae bacterium]|nr:hypothetical protein [Chitinophagaceae bacterium]